MKTLLTAAMIIHPACGDRADIIDKLKTRYHESAIAIGVTHDGNMAEILSSKDGETWSFVVTRPDGRTCLIAAGTGWDRLDVPVGRGL